MISETDISTEYTYAFHAHMQRRKYVHIVHIHNTLYTSDIPELMYSIRTSKESICFAKKPDNFAFEMP